MMRLIVVEESEKFYEILIGQCVGNTGRDDVEIDVTVKRAVQYRRVHAHQLPVDSVLDLMEVVFQQFPDR